ncbi:MAG: hypothetical protein ACREJB_05520 [Planctomycetaceae bacterium]
MSEKQYELNPVEYGAGGDPAGSGGGGLAALREAGEDFFNAADAAIAGALSSDSLTFNQATQQEGGE